MDQNTIILVTVAAGLVAVATIYCVAVKLKAKGKDGAAVIEKVDKGITYAQSIAEAVTPFLPQPAGPIINKILDVSQKAVVHVEGNYKAAISLSTSGASGIPSSASPDLIRLVASALRVSTALGSVLIAAL